MPQTPAHRRVRSPRSTAPHADVGTATPSLLQSAHLHPVPSTLLIPLAARAQGPRYFPWLDCRDAVAGALLQRLGADVAALLDDLPTVFQVLWRTRAVQDAGHAFFAEYTQALRVRRKKSAPRRLDGPGAPQHLEHRGQIVQQRRHIGT